MAMAYKRCKQAFVATLGGRRRRVAEGEIVSTDNPLYRGRERLFEDVEAYVQREPHTSVTKRVEQATAAPGEGRTLTKPKNPPQSTSKKGGSQ